MDCFRWAQVLRLNERRSLRLGKDPVGLGPFPKHLELSRRRLLHPGEMIPMLDEHMCEGLTGRRSAVWIGAALEELQRVGVGLFVTVVQPLARSVKQEAVAVAASAGLGHRGIDVDAALQQQRETRVPLALGVAADVPI